MRTGLLLLMLAIPAVAPGQDKGGLPLPAPGNVTLPLGEYNKLVELANKPVKKPDTPPLPYAIKRADLKLQVKGEKVSGTMQLDGEILSKGEVKVPLVSGMTILDAQQKGKELPLQQESGTHVAVLPGPGEFSIALDIGLALTIEAGRAAFNLPLPAAGAVRLSLMIPGDHTNVNLTPGLITGRTSANGQTTIEATLAPGQPASIWWATREVAAPQAPREVRFVSDVKTLASVGEAELRVEALAAITVLQGEPAQFELEAPAGWEIRGATGLSLESSETQSGALILKVGKAAQRSHLFLITMAKPISEAKVDVPMLHFKGAQRETGETLVEAEGTIELTAKESGGMKRMDFKETDASLLGLARHPLQAAFRYHWQPAETPGLALEWVRFPESKVLAAVAQRAVVTTLVTSEGKSLTEVRLVLKNQAQPFLKVALPAGASIVSADVAGTAVKPVLGADGNRVPLLRAGFRPMDTYAVSFVVMHSGAPFAKKGDSELSLPKMDLPIGLLQWEVFLPERYKVREFGGDVIEARLLPPGSAQVEGGEVVQIVDLKEEVPVTANFNATGLLPGQLGGTIVDPSGAEVSNALVTVIHEATGATMKTYANSSGQWMVANVPSGRLRITVESSGFVKYVRVLNYSATRPPALSFALRLGVSAESVTVQSESAEISETVSGGRQRKSAPPPPPPPPSSNVMNLQRRVAGVLPIKVDVPREGSSYRFVRTLVIDEETKVTFAYKTNK